MFLASQQDIRIVTLPDELDPCDFLTQCGAGGLQPLVDSAPDALAYKLRSLTRGIDLVRDVACGECALEKMLNLMAQMPTGTRKGQGGQWLRRRQALQAVGQTFRLPVETLEQRLRQLRASARSPVVVRGHRRGFHTRRTDTRSLGPGVAGTDFPPPGLSEGYSRGHPNRRPHVLRRPIGLRFMVPYRRHATQRFVPGRLAACRGRAVQRDVGLHPRTFRKI